MMNKMKLLQPTGPLGGTAAALFLAVSSPSRFEGHPSSPTSSMGFSLSAPSTSIELMLMLRSWVGRQKNEGLDNEGIKHLGWTYSRTSCQGRCTREAGEGVLVLMGHRMD